MQRSIKLCLIVALLVPSLACTTKDKGTPPEPGAPEPATAKVEAEPAPGPKLPDAAELLAAHVEAAGGVAAIDAIDSVYAVGKVESKQQKLAGTMSMWWQKGGKFYLEQEIEGVGKSRMGYDGNTIWLEDPITGLRELEGEEAASYLQSAMMFPGHEWRTQFAEAKTIAKQPLEGGGEVWEIELVSSKGPNMILGLDTETKLLRYTKTNQITLMGSLPLEAFAEEYREVAGYKFPMRKRSRVKSLIELQEEITDLQVNVPIDESKFAFPTKLEAVPSDPAEQPPVEGPAPAPTPDTPDAPDKSEK